MPVATNPDIAVPPSDPVPSNPNRMRSGPNHIVAADPKPPAPQTNRPIAWQPNVLRARSYRYGLNLWCRRGLGHDFRIGGSLRLGRDRGGGGISYLPGWALVARLWGISVSRPWLVDRWLLVSWDVLDPALYTASYQNGKAAC